MSITFEDFLEGKLNIFYSIDLDDENKRRMALKPLHDYFQILILESGVHRCSLYRNSIEQMSLKARWDSLKRCLVLIEDPAQWDMIIYALHKERIKVEHDNYHIPSKDILLSIAEKAREVKDWVLSASRKYFAESEGFSFIQVFSGEVSVYVGKSDWLLHQYGEMPPYSTENDYIPKGEEHPYTVIKSLRDYLLPRSLEIRSINDLESKDLKNLIELVKIIESLEAKESILITKGICPKCGKRIVDSQRAVGGPPDGSEPSTIIYRVGCENCDYELHYDTIDI